MLEREIAEHERRIAERDRRNRLILDALAAGKTPPSWTPTYPHQASIQITGEDIEKLRTIPTWTEVREASKRRDGVLPREDEPFDTDHD